MLINSTTGEPGPSEQSLDLAVLSRVLGTDDETVLKRFLILYWDTAGGTPTELRQHFAARDAKSLRHAAHRAKGASISTGAVLASSLLEKLETAAVHADWNRIEAILTEIDAAFHELEQYLSLLNVGSN